MYRFTPALRAELRDAYSFAGTRKEFSLRLKRLYARTGWPRHAFTIEAKRLGIVQSRRFWTKEEDEVLAETVGRLSMTAVARKVQRPYESVVARVKVLHLSQRVRTGFSRKDIAELLGVGTQTVQRWMDRGWLGKVHETNNGNRVSEANVRKFIREHHAEYDLRRVDQYLYKAVVFEWR